jgi:hypothetical protein
LDDDGEAGKPGNSTTEERFGGEGDSRGEFFWAGRELFPFGVAVVGVAFLGVALSVRGAKLGCAGVGNEAGT